MTLLLAVPSALGVSRQLFTVKKNIKKDNDKSFVRQFYRLVTNTEDEDVVIKLSYCKRIQKEKFCLKILCSFNNSAKLALFFETHYVFNMFLILEKF